MTFRTDIVDYLKAQWSMTPIHELEGYVSITDLPSDSVEGIQLAIDFVVAEEQMVSIAVKDQDGYRQDGTLLFVLLNPLGQGSAPLLLIGENLLALFRGRRIGDTVISSVSPFVLNSVQGKWQVWTSRMNFYHDLFQ
jgi:hypothetical protein